MMAGAALMKASAAVIACISEDLKSPIVDSSRRRGHLPACKFRGPIRNVLPFGRIAFALIIL